MDRKLNQQIKKLEEKTADLENKWKRALADYDNLEKRITKEKEEFVKFSNAALLNKLLRVLDDLSLCERYLKDKGLKIAYNRFREVLTSEGVEKIAVVEGGEFDPGTMEAVEVVSGPKNRVTEVVQEGYWLVDKALRPAKVKVGDGKVTRRQKGEPWQK